MGWFAVTGSERCGHGFNGRIAGVCGLAVFSVRFLEAILGCVGCRSKCEGGRAVPAGLARNCLFDPALPCRAFTYRRFAAGVWRFYSAGFPRDVCYFCGTTEEVVEKHIFVRSALQCQVSVKTPYSFKGGLPQRWKRCATQKLGTSGSSRRTGVSAPQRPHPNVESHDVRMGHSTLVCCLTGAMNPPARAAHGRCCHRSTRPGSGRLSLWEHFLMPAEHRTRFAHRAG